MSLLTAEDYDEVTLTAPGDPRLPGGGGYPVSFLVRNNRSVLGVSDPYYTTTKDFVTFAPTILFYDPGFSVIDASQPLRALITLSRVSTSTPFSYKR